MGKFRFGIFCVSVLFFGVLQSDEAWTPFNYPYNMTIIIDTDTNTVEEVFGDGAASSFGIAFNPDGTFAYLTDVNNPHVIVVDCATRLQVATITVGTMRTFKIAITSDGAFAYVGAYLNGAVVVVDLSSNTAIATITTGANSQGLALSPDNTLVYSAIDSGSPGRVAVISTATNTVIATITTLGDTPFGMAFTTDSKFAYIGQQTNIAQPLLVVDTPTSKVIATITLATPRIRELVTTPNGEFVYVFGGSSNHWINLLSTTTNTVVATVTLAGFSGGCAFTTDGASAYITNSDDSLVVVLDTASLIFVATITLPLSYPYPIAIRASAAPPPPVPLTLKINGETRQNRFLTQKEIFNVISWLPVYGETVTGYGIAWDAPHTDQIGIVSADTQPLRYEDHNLRKSTTYTYYVVAMNRDAVVGEGSVAVRTGN